MTGIAPAAPEGDKPNQTSPGQGEPLLRIKLFTPPVRSDCVIRRRLFEQLQRGLDKPLTLVCAPAGYGKTTLVSSWLAAAKIPSSWWSLDEDDNDPARFLQYLLTAFQKIIPSVQMDLLGLLQDSRPDSTRLLLNVLVNRITESGISFVLVLDDVHMLHSLPVLDNIAYLCEHMPPQMHLLLLSRSDPLLPLSRMRARGQLLEMRADQLRFSREEIFLFLNDHQSLDLAHGDIQALETRTEGWIAGLQMASIAMQMSSDRHQSVETFTGSHHYIMDYLVEEVFKVQDDAVRSFLLRTSILDRMCASLCEAVLETMPGESANARAMLAALEQANLFLIPLDEERRWYRYHHLFAEVLHRRLEQSHPDLIPALHSRASRWYEQNGSIAGSIQHARLAGETERTARLVDQNGCELLMRGEVVNLLRWIAAVEPWSQKLPWIAIQKAWALCINGQVEQAEEPLQSAERLVFSLEVNDDVRVMQGAVYAARAQHANLQGESRLAAGFARQALDALPSSSDFSCSLRGAATSILGDASWMEGNLAEAQHAHSQALQISQAAGNLPMRIITSINLADILFERGLLFQAAEMYNQALKLAAPDGGQISPLADRVHAGLGRIHYEWNHLETARQHARHCVEIAQRWENHDCQALGCLILAKLDLANDQKETALRTIQEAERLLHGRHTHGRLDWIEAYLAELWISLGDPDRAFDLAQQNGPPPDHLPDPGKITSLQLPWLPVALRLCLARGSEVDALELSNRILQALEESGQSGRMVEAHILHALVLQQMKETAQAEIMLKKALALARPEGYRRIFLDESEPMARLLRQVIPAGTGAGYAVELLSAMRGAPCGALPQAQDLIEPLTARELEVLKLIEGGCSNAEIAGKLVISLPTVKRHISNLYAKLGVETRTRALGRARELNLLK